MPKRAWEEALRLQEVLREWPEGVLPGLRKELLRVWQGGVRMPEGVRLGVSFLLEILMVA